MLRFLAFLHDAGDEEQARACDETLRAILDGSAHAWRQVHRGSGLSLWLAGGHGAGPAGGASDDQSGFVVGRLVASDSAAPGLRGNSPISRPDAISIFRSRGRSLGAGYWGSYVAFLRDPDSGRYAVIRDPTGGLPCFHVVHRGIRLFFSDIADLRRSGLFSFTVNAEFLKANVLLPRLQKTITGLNNVSEVLPGEFWVQDRPAGERAFIWNPYDIVRGPPVEDVAAAAALLRRTIERTVWSLAEPYDRIVHHLGGLDSSIVYACLATAPSRPQLSLINSSPLRRAATSASMSARWRRCTEPR